MLDVKCCEMLVVQETRFKFTHFFLFHSFVMEYSNQLELETGNFFFLCTIKKKYIQSSSFLVE